MATATNKARTSRRPSRGAIVASESVPMQFLSFEDNGGHHWTLLDCHGNYVARSPSFTSGPPTGRLVSKRQKSHPIPSAGFRARRVRKVADMKTTFPMESHNSRAPGIIPEPSVVHDEPAAATRRGSAVQ